MSNVQKNQLPIKIIIPLLLLFTIAAGWYLHVSARERILHQEAEELTYQTHLRENLLLREIDDARLKVRFLYSTPPVQGLVRATQNNGVDPYDGTRLSQWKLRLETIFEAYLENNPSVSQARYIGIADQGRELVRVERTLGNIKVVEPTRMQRKADRDYFKQVSKLGPQQIYISEINLNREFGKVVFPYQPTYRAGIPVYDADGDLFGMLVINIDAREILNELQSGLPAGVGLLLLNSTDGFIAHPDADNVFSQDLGTTTDWHNVYQILEDRHFRLERLREQSSGVEYYAMESVISIPHSDNGHFMRLVLKTPVALVEEELFHQSTQSLVVAGGVLALVIVFLVIYQANVSKDLRISEAQAQFEAIIEGSSDAIVGMNTLGVVTSWNTSAQDILGYSPRQASGQSLEHLMAVGSRQQELDQAIKQVAMGKYHEPLRLVLTRRNQSLLHVSMALSPIMLDSLTVVGVAAIIRDVTSQVEAEEEIQKMNASLEKQVRERTAELESARNEALSASRTKSSFIANVSHEMRTPLNGIIGMHKLLRRATLPEQRNQYLAMAETSAESLAVLINDVLDLSKIEAGKLELESIGYNLMAMVSDVVMSMSIKAHEKNIELILDVAELQHSAVTGDRGRLRQILTNLIGNAIKFTETGWVKLTVRTELTKSKQVQVCLQVQDTGVGIAAEKQASIFEAFSQEDSSVTRRFGGTGLGLSITRQLCHLLGGEIRCESEKDKGCTFTCTLLQTTTSPNQRVDRLDLSGKRFLVVDTNAEAATALSRQLQCWQADYVKCLSSLRDCATFSELTSQQPYDLILMDADFAEPATLAAVDSPVALLVHSLDRNRVYNNGGSQIKLAKPVTPQSLAGLLYQVGVSPLLPAGLSPTVATEEKMSAVLDLSGLNILVVDDNRINQQVAVGMLEDYGASLFTADNGKEALAMLSQSAFHMILMDCQMPIMDGYTATREIRKGAAGDAAAVVPIVAMTASAMAGDRERCMRAGMDDYITKPLEPEELETRLVYWAHQIKRHKPIVSGGSTATVKPAQSTSLELERYPVWDCAALEKRVKYKPERMLEMIRIFKEVTTEKLNQLCVAIEHHQFETIESIAHSIKGSAGNLGAVRLQMLCQTIEKESRAKARAPLQKAGARLPEELELLLAELNRYGPANQSAS